MQLTNKVVEVSLQGLIRDIPLVWRLNDSVDVIINFSIVLDHGGVTYVRFHSDSFIAKIIQRDFVFSSV